MLEAVSKPLESEEDESDKDESAVEMRIPFIACGDASEVVKPGEDPFDLPSSPVAPELSAVLCLRSLPPAAMRTDQFDVLPAQTASQRIAVVSAVGDEAFETRKRDHPLRFFDRDFGERDFGRGSRRNVDSERKTLAVRQYQ